LFSTSAASTVEGIVAGYQLPASKLGEAICSPEAWVFADD
jgi:hypothetical protein